MPVAESNANKKINKKMNIKFYKRTSVFVAQVIGQARKLLPQGRLDSISGTRSNQSSRTDKNLKLTAIFVH